MADRRSFSNLDIMDARHLTTLSSMSGVGPEDTNSGIGVSELERKDFSTPSAAMRLEL